MLLRMNKIQSDQFRTNIYIADLFIYLYIEIL